MGPEFRVNTYFTGTQAEPSARYDPFGNFVVVWRSTGQDGSADGIFGQRFSPILPVELTGIRIE